MPSHLANFILWLHERAVAEGRVPDISDEALDLLDAVEMGGDRESACRFPNVAAGAEIYAGRPRCELARQIQRRAIARTRRLGLVLLNVDEVGYTPLNVRALLTHHFVELMDADVGTGAHSAKVDLELAANRATDRSRAAAWLLIAGYSSPEIGRILGTNGSRVIGRAMKELATILEGGPDVTQTAE